MGEEKTGEKAYQGWRHVMGQVKGGGKAGEKVAQVAGDGKAR
jgi:hypothetical protein